MKCKDETYDATKKAKRQQENVSTIEAYSKISASLGKRRELTDIQKKQIKDEYLRLRAAAEAVEGGGICKVYGLVEDTGSWADNNQKHKMCIVMKKYDGTLINWKKKRVEQGCS